MGFKKVAIVDDDPDILFITKASLKTLKDVEVLTLMSGSAAVKELPAFAPDIVLIDVMMPDMDGRQTLELLKKDPIFEKTLFFFFTARVLVQEVEEYKKLGVVDVIIKPFDPLTLPANLQRYWELQHPTSS